MRTKENIKESVKECVKESVRKTPKMIWKLSTEPRDTGEVCLSKASVVGVENSVEKRGFAER